LLSKNLKIRIYEYKTITLPVVLHGCEPWSLTLREEHSLRVFEQKRDEVTGERRKLHNEELHDLHSSPQRNWNNQVEEDEVGGANSTNGEKRNAYRLLVGEPEGRRQLGRPIRRWVDNIRMVFGEVGWGDVDWIGLSQDGNRWGVLLNSALNLQVS
jgi:hypothetical protein